MVDIFIIYQRFKTGEGKVKRSNKVKLPLSNRFHSSLFTLEICLKYFKKILKMFSASRHYFFFNFLAHPIQKWQRGPFLLQVDSLWVSVAIIHSTEMSSKSRMNRQVEFGAKAYNDKIWINKVLNYLKEPVAFWAIKNIRKFQKNVLSVITFPFFISKLNILTSCLKCCLQLCTPYLFTLETPMTWTHIRDKE